MNKNMDNTCNCAYNPYERINIGDVYYRVDDFNNDFTFIKYEVVDKFNANLHSGNVILLNHKKGFYEPHYVNDEFEGRFHRFKEGAVLQFVRENKDVFTHKGLSSLLSKLDEFDDISYDIQQILKSEVGDRTSRAQMTLKQTRRAYETAKDDYAKLFDVNSKLLNVIDYSDDMFDIISVEENKQFYQEVNDAKNKEREDRGINGGISYGYVGDVLTKYGVDRNKVSWTYPNYGKSEHDGERITNCWNYNGQPIIFPINKNQYEISYSVIENYLLTYLKMAIKYNTNDLRLFSDFETPDYYDTIK